MQSVGSRRAVNETSWFKLSIMADVEWLSTAESNHRLAIMMDI